MRQQQIRQNAIIQAKLDAIIANLTAARVSARMINKVGGRS